MENNRFKPGNGSSNSRSSREANGKMSRQQVGHLGGIAPHSCRGFACQQQRESGRSSSNRSNQGSENND